MQRVKANYNNVRGVSEVKTPHHQTDYWNKPVNIAVQEQKNLQETHAT